MKRLTFTTPTPKDYKDAGYPFDTVLWYIDPTPKKRLELVFGQLTDQQYEDHIIQRNLSVNPRMIGLTIADLKILELPSSREFRDAWCDITAESRVDIDLSKAKELQLRKLRLARQQAFVDLGFPQKLNPEIEDAILSSETKAKIQSLRDATEPLKALEVSGYNDEAVLKQIRELGTLNVTI